jgi:hypothetical protein
MEPLYVDAYSFDEVTGEYIGVSKAWADPLTPGEYMLPGSATFIQPPAYQQGKARFWANWAWEYRDLVPDTTPVEEVQTEEQAAAAARSIRNRMLAATDWTQVRDCPINATSSFAFAEYRQALRDVPQQAGFPLDIQWPVPPAYVKRA